LLADLKDYSPKRRQEVKGTTFIHLFNQTKTENDRIDDQGREPERTSLDLTHIELEEQIAEVLRAASTGLTGASICAVLALRHEISGHMVLMRLLLEGELHAEAVDEHGPLSSSNFRFYRCPPDDESTPDKDSEATT
jgi:hypothetical protein